MVYVTVKQKPSYRQMTLQEYLFGKEPRSCLISRNTANTRTYVTEQISSNLLTNTDIPGLVRTLDAYNTSTEALREKPRETLYNTFYVEKKGKGMPHVFKTMFSVQSKYIKCNSSELCKAIGAKVHEMLSQHPTELDEKITDEVVTYCTELLSDRGFQMTTDTFRQILKESYRRIDAPKEELKCALYQLKTIFEEVFGALHHTSAFAYVKNRSTIDAVRRHQSNESKWFGKFDLSNFFGSTTVDFIMQMFSMIFPFSEIVKYPVGREALENALSLCTLKGVLPQGTPISPTITNVMMIPIDHKLTNELRNFNGQHFIYTRYADDFLISSKYNFRFRDVEKLISDTLAEFNAPFSLNAEKTRYGSSAGSNWNLGVMLNKDNQITVGYKNKRKFQAMLSDYVMDRKSGKQWDKADVQAMEGYRNYYSMVEGDTIDRIIAHISKKFNVEVVQLIKADMRA